MVKKDLTLFEIEIAYKDTLNKKEEIREQIEATKNKLNIIEERITFTKNQRENIKSNPYALQYYNLENVDNFFDKKDILMFYAPYVAKNNYNIPDKLPPQDEVDSFVNDAEKKCDDNLLILEKFKAKYTDVINILTYDLKEIENKLSIIKGKRQKEIDSLAEEKRELDKGVLTKKILLLVEEIGFADKEEDFSNKVNLIVRKLSKEKIDTTYDVVRMTLNRNGYYSTRKLK